MADLIRKLVVLDTRDKRWTFLHLFFRDELPYLNLEGAPKECAIRIIDRFQKNGIIEELEEKAKAI